jgi:hypothetical protein
MIKFVQKKNLKILQKCTTVLYKIPVPIFILMSYYFLNNLTFEVIIVKIMKS